MRVCRLSWPLQLTTDGASHRSNVCQRFAGVLPKHIVVMHVRTDYGTTLTDAGAADLPLWGKRIVVTAPRQYAAKLGAALLEAGAVELYDPSLLCWLVLSFCSSVVPWRPHRAVCRSVPVPLNPGISFVHDVSLLLQASYCAHLIP